MLHTIWQDVRHAARTLRGSPLFTAVSILSLAIGIAGTAVIFSLADAYLFRARPGVADSARLVELGRIDTETASGDVVPGAISTFSYPNYLDYLERQTVFDALAAIRTGVMFGLGGEPSAVRVSGVYVSANYFSVLGVPMALGRGFLPDDERPGSPTATAIISDRLWRTQFGGDPSAIGRTIRLNGRAFTVVGVAGGGFDGHMVDSAALWVPLTGYPDGDDLTRFGRRGQQWLMGVGRLKTGVTTAQAASEMTRIAADLEREYPDDNLRHGLAVHPLGPLPFDSRAMITRYAAVLFAFVSLILFIACTNVGAMVLARGVSRTREMALRLALGADRGHIVRLLVVESLLVTAVATTVALAGAGVGIRLLEPLMGMIQVVQIIAYDVALDWRVTAFSVMVAVVTSVICGLLPAVQAARVDLAAAMMARDNSGTPRRLRTRQAFVVAQVGMSVLLVVCALLLGRSLRNANAIDPGFALDGIEVAGLDFRLGGYDVKTGPALADGLMSRIQMLPGLESAAYARVVPLTREAEGGRVWLPDERGDDRAIAANWNFVTPDYFRTLRLPLVGGRTFAVHDRIGAPAVAIVNETFARRVWPGKDAVGQRLVVGVSRRPLEVVGVARDSKYRGVGDPPTSFIYVPHAQRPETITWLLMRPTGASLLPAVRALIAESSPNLPVLQAGALTEIAASGLFPHRVASWLAGVVATIGVFLAAIGIYGLAAYNVRQRTREIGVRMALGALRSQVMRSVVGGAAVLAGIGAVLGVGAAALMTTLLAGMLYGVQPIDAVSFAGGAAALFAVAFVASLAPARRAASVNPVDALRAE